jgi:hypothetical protein
MTVKGNTITVTEKELKNVRIGANGINELEETLLAAGYELAVESVDVR